MSYPDPTQLLRTSLFLVTVGIAGAQAPPVDQTRDQIVDRREVPARRPNILFIFSDDHATDVIGAYGGRLASVDPTPRIDQLAAEGMVFKRSFCTNSICGPSRAVILTGKHSHVNGFRQNGNKFDGSQPTFPKMLREAGYMTALIGKWHLGTTPEGFDYWDVLPGQGAYYNPRLRQTDGPRTVEGHCTDIVTDLAIAWLEENKSSVKPWMLMCQHKAPHRTWMPAARHLDLYADMEMPIPSTLFDDHADDASGALNSEMGVDEHMELFYDLFVPPKDGSIPEGGRALDGSGYRNLKRMNDAQRAAWDAAFDPRNEAFHAAKLRGPDLVRWKYQRYVKNYLRCVRGVDESVGRLVDWLAENGLEDSTIVIYSSDQGFYLGDHGWFDKRWMYEESLEMPFIVRWPGVIKPGSTSNAMIQNLDYAPTFLDVAGAAIPNDMQGHSLVPLLSGETPDDWRDAIYYRYYEFPGSHQVPRHYGVRTDRYKLMYFHQLDEWEFFDLEADPDELTNLFGSVEHATTIARLAVRLGELKSEALDLD